jgi:hypothetical protein
MNGLEWSFLRTAHPNVDGYKITGHPEKSTFGAVLE